ncbi:MAG TPA: hypothetical protein DEH25_08620 [Chloroflexi bacterium]|nr:hypothetical protein [Chloroflexota bacterium]
MSTQRIKFRAFGFILMAGLVLSLALPVLAFILSSGSVQTASAQTACQELLAPGDIPSPVLINFDDLANAVVIGDHYRPSFGVKFENSGITQALTYGNEPANAASAPNVAINNAIFPNTSSNVPMVIDFDEPKTHVGFYMGNGDNQQTVGLLTAFDAAGKIICQFRHVPVPDAHTEFIGIYDPSGSILRVTWDYGSTALSESIDDLYFSPRRGIAPTRTPEPTWTPIPSAVPTQGPTPTSTPVIPMMPYYPAPKAIIKLPNFSIDLAIHGIEITQGIQCFDTSKGLSTCPDNSLPVATQKDSTARVYLKLSSVWSSKVNTVPVRLYIIANGVTYTANAYGNATKTIDQGTTDSADIYFNVNFTNNVPVSFYAVVDPDNIFTESNESNNRYPASGTITLNFQKRDTLKIVGQRLYYHPSGYSGNQYAQGWAVNGGAADWFEQVLPIRNGAVNYVVKSGYLNWTENLSSGDSQHDLIKTLNAYWILENAFSWWFSGTFTGADHVYGWAPNDGYSGGHADMPVYPHAGGLGVVGIGTDRPGTNTDTPGGGALIFGHELVHDYDVFHTDTSDACGSNDGNSDFPYGNSSIQEFGFNPYTGKIYNPATTHDLMSYCPANGSKQGWISPFTWNKMFSKLTPGLINYQLSGRTPPLMTFMPSVTEESLVVNATIFNPLYQPAQPGLLGELYHIEGGAAYYLPQGDYAIELRGGKGEVLYSQPFYTDFKSEYDGHSGTPTNPATDPPFSPDPTLQADVSFIIPWVDGTASVALTYLGETFDEHSVSSNPPQVLITSPSAVESWQRGSQHTLTWQGLDVDGDPLTYSVFYSNDNGLSWVMLASELTNPNYTVQTDSLAGGSDVRFRVVASDGVNTGLDETDQAISVPNHAPEVTIMNPVEGKTYLPGSAVILQGSATDMEDGTLPESALAWSSNVQGGLGTGTSVALNVLTPGVHTITLKATDSLGKTTSTTVSILIGYDIYLPLVIR